MTNVHQLNAPKPALPKLSEGDAAQLIHDSYLAQIRNQGCLNCNCGEKWIELYEVWVHPTKTQHSALAVKRPTNRILEGFPLNYFEIPATTVPVCSECITTYKVGTGDPIPAASREEWARTLVRKYAPEPSKSSRPEPTLDQL